MTKEDVRKCLIAASTAVTVFGGVSGGAIYAFQLLDGTLEQIVTKCVIENTNVATSYRLQQFNSYDRYINAKTNILALDQGTQACATTGENVQASKAKLELQRDQHWQDISKYRELANLYTKEAEKCPEYESVLGL